MAAISLIIGGVAGLALAILGYTLVGLSFDEALMCWVGGGTAIGLGIIMINFLNLGV